MNREERGLALEFEGYLQEELGITKEMQRSKMITGVSCKIKIKDVSINRTTGYLRPKVWTVEIFALAKDGRFKAQANAVYNMRQVGGREGAKRALGALLWDSLCEQERIADQRMMDEQASIAASKAEPNLQISH